MKQNQPPSPATPEAEGAETLEHVHITDKQAVITGDPAELPDSVADDDTRRHNCDQMGCPTLDHVLYRLPFTDHRKPIDIKALARQLAESIDFTAGPVQARDAFEKWLDVLVIPAAPIQASGWVMVPREPTQKMLLAGNEAIAAPTTYANRQTENAWHAMLSVAPGETK